MIIFLIGLKDFNNMENFQEVLSELEKNIYASNPYIRDIDLLTEDPEKKVYLIYGRIQSGKTSSIIAVSHLTNYYNMNNIIIVPNITEGYFQLRDRINEYNSQVKNKVSTLFVGDKSSQNEIKKYFHKDNKETRTIIALGNHKELQFLKDMLEEFKDSHKSYVLSVDEADLSYKSDDTKYQSQYISLVEKAKKVINVTATSFKLWFCEENLYTPNIIKISENKNYKGISNFSYKYIPEELECRPPNRKERALDTDEYFSEYLVQKGDEAPFKLSSGEVHPHIVLYRCSEILNKHHTQILEDLMKEKNVKNKWSIITYNGDGLLLYDKRLTSRLNILGEKSVYKKSVHKFSRIGLKDILEWMRTNGKHSFSHILVVAGKYANRMISFVSSSYKWHLTSMYLMVNRTTCDNLLQMCRLCGVYDDNINLELVSHKKTINDINKALTLQEKVLFETSEKKQILEHVTEMTIPKTILPSQRLVKGVSYYLNVEKTSIVPNTYYRIDRDSVKGIGERILKVLVDIVSETKNVWVERNVVVNRIMTMNNDFVKSINQVNGHLSSIAEKSVVINNCDVQGLLVKKEESRWFFRIN